MNKCPLMPIRVLTQMSAKSHSNISLNPFKVLGRNDTTEGRFVVLKAVGKLLKTDSTSTFSVDTGQYFLYDQPKA